MGAKYELSNEQVSLAIDDQGRLLQLVNRHTGHDYLQLPGLPPWRIFYRIGRGVEQDQAMDLEIHPAGQEVRIVHEAGSLTLHYDRLTATAQHQAETRVLDVGLTLRIALDGDMLTCTATIENRQAGIEVTEIWVPWIYGLGHMGLGRAADVLYWPERGGRRIQDPFTVLSRVWALGGDPERNREPPWFRLTYPWPASMQWYTLNNGQGGLYIASYDRTLMTSCLNVMAHPDGALSASIVKYPFVKTGETWTSEPTVLRLYRGDWHEAARTYRAWADTWIKPPSPPAWLRRAPGWVKPFLKAQNGHIRGVYADFPAMLERAQAVGMGILHCFGWVRQGFDNRYPHYSPDELLGGEEGLVEALRQVRDAGGQTILYTQGQLLDPTTEFYRTKGHRISAKDIWGHEYREQYAFFNEGTLLQVMRNKWFGVACPSAPGWIDQLLSQFEMVYGYGAQGILYDQMGGMPPYICYSEEHDHDKPSLAVGPGKVRNMARLREAIKARDPDFAFVTELVTDCYCEYVDIIHSHGIGFWPAPESFGEMFRYTFPEPVITNRADVQGERQKHFGFAFSLGLRFDANTADTENPEVASYLGRLCALYTRYGDLLLEGRFVDDEGFVCDNNQVSTHAFVAGHGLAVTVWNPSDLPQQFRIVAPGYVLKEAAWQDPSWSGPGHAILPGEVAVQVFHKG